MRDFRAHWRATNLTAAIAAAVLPAVAALLSIHFLTEGSLADFRPYLNDEVYYWHQIATAADVGTGGGYYTVEERVAPQEALRFGPHGPVFPLLAGLAARIGRWHVASAPVFNMAWVLLCTLACAALARPTPGRAWLIVAILATFWPLPFWASSNMQESFHHGAAILMAGALIALGRRETKGLVAAWTLMPILLLIRPSWIVLLPGLCVMSLRERTPWRVAIACACSAAIAAASLLAFGALAPPLPGGFEFLSLVRLEQGYAPLIANIQANVVRLGNTTDDYDPLELIHRAEYLGLTVLVLIAAVWYWRRESSQMRLQVAVQASQLAGIVCAMVALYTLTNWTEHRIISAHLLLASMVLATVPGRLAPAIALVLVAVNVLTAPVYAESFRQNRTDNFVWDRRPLRVFEETIAARLRYNAGAPPWCNTLLSAQYPPDFVAVPPGIGISITRNPDEIALPVRSRYLLLDERTHEILGPRLQLERIGALPYGTVYLNLSVRCPP